jgi:hypothetical protein
VIAAINEGLVTASAIVFAAAGAWVYVVDAILKDVSSLQATLQTKGSTKGNAELLGHKAKKRRKRQRGAFILIWLIGLGLGIAAYAASNLYEQRS